MGVARHSAPAALSALRGTRAWILTATRTLVPHQSPQRAEVACKRMQRHTDEAALARAAREDARTRVEIRNAQISHGLEFEMPTDILVRSPPCCTRVLSSSRTRLGTLPSVHS